MLEETLKISSSQIEEQPGCFLITLEGELDGSNTQEFVKYALDMVDQHGLKHFIADFTKLRYINSTGLGAIIKIARVLMTKSGSLMIVNPNENVFEIIEIVGANRLLSIHQTKEEALDSLK